MRKYFVMLCMLGLVGGCTQSDSNTPSHIKNLVVASCQTTAMLLKPSVEVTPVATKTDVAGGTQIMIPKAYHICQGDYSFAATVKNDTLMLNTVNGSTSSTCVCQSDISFVYDGQVTATLHWLNYDGKYYQFSN